MIRVDSPEDPSLGDFRNLIGSTSRVDVHNRRSQIVIVEGVLAAEQLLHSQLTVRFALLTTERAEKLTELADALVDRGAEILIADRSVLEAVTGFDVHRGVLVSADRPPPLPLHDLIDSSRRIVMLESVNDHENLGSVFRNAAALGLDGVVLDERCADPLYRRSIRVSSGWALRLPYSHVSSLKAGVGQLRSAGFGLVALSPTPTALAVGEAAERGLLDDPVAFVLGAEGPGLRTETMDQCDTRVRIPMSHEVDSLNVATSLAVVASFAASRRAWR